MIIKNISPVIKAFPELNNLQLMPGEQQDISQFSQKERDNCFVLQDAFRKAEVICIGIGQHDRPDVDVKMRLARARYMQKAEDEPVLDREWEDEEVYIEERTGVKIIQNPAPATITQNVHGVTEVHYFEPPVKSHTPEPSSSTFPTEHPTLTPERVREILSKKCIGTKTNGRACKRWACKGFEYCVIHMPEDLRKKYKQMKKEEFFS